MRRCRRAAAPSSSPGPRTARSSGSRRSRSRSWTEPVPRNLGPDLTEDVRDGPPPPLDGFAMVPVWVEAGYDGGRFAGWVPSVPGVLAVADSPIRALSLAVTNTARVRGWLEGHGDEAGIPRLWRAELAGNVTATTREDGYEVNATLPTDQRLVGDLEVATALRRLGWAREDLLDLVD